MAVTKEQMAKWSKNFEARYPNEKKNTGTGTQTRTQTTAVRQVTAAQMNQWEQGYQTMQANREREERNRTSPMTNKVTLAQQAAARNPAQTGTAAQSRLPASVTAAKQPEWTNGTRKVLGTVTADELARNVLGYMDEPEKSHTGSPVKTDRQEDYEPDWNYAGNDNTPKQRAIAQGTYGSYAKAAQTAGNLLSKDRQTDRFDELNQWMDADPKNRELVNLLRQKKTNYTSYAQEGTSAPGSTAPGGGTTGKTYAERGTTQTDGDRWNTEAKYTDAQLRAKGYTQQQINKARQYLKEYSAFNPAETLTRRTADTTKGILATVVSAVPMAGEDAVQAVKNETATTQNWKELQESVQGDARQKELLRLMTSGKVRYAETSHAMQPSGVAEEPKSTAYTDRELIKKGYSQDEIDAMRQRIAGVKVRDAVDQDTSLGYQLYHYGQQRTAAAQAGLSPAVQTAAGIAASAAENLAVAGINPALVLPVLSAQGAAESMGQSMEQGDSAGTALATGLAKFGAGWAINSVGAADLAKTMGADYAKETVAGRIADFVRGLSGSSEFAKAYPVVVNAISGGIDNAMQAFVETYADTAIDAVLGGDQESAEALLKPETFLQAVQSGLTGGASGALGGAVGTGLGKMNAELDARTAPTRQERAKQVQELAERMLEPGELEQQAGPAEERQEAAPAAQTEQPGETVRAAEQPAVQSDNAAVQRYAAAVQADSLTNKTLDLFTPKAANAENRAALAEAYGVELPATASETRRMLRQLAQEQRTAAEAKTGELAQTAEPMQTEPAAQVEAPAADPGQSTVEKAGETVESGQGYSVSMSNDTMTVRFADGTEAVRKIDPENPRTMLFDPEQLHRQAQAESRAEAPQEIPAVQQTEARADGMRETLGMTRQTLNQKQYSVQKELERWKVSRGASETISRMVPDSISDLNRYTTAASSLYRMGQMEGVKSFDQALKLAGGMNNLAPNTNYVLQQPGGRVALEAAWTQGRGELEAGTLNSGMLGGALSEKSTKGEGRVFWRNSARAEDRVGTQLIALNARGTGTDAILKSVLRGPDGAPSTRVKAYVETETGRIFFGDAVDDVFGTILHEDLHWYNALDQEGAAGFQDQALEYLANGLGFENVDEMIRGKLNDYAAQGLTYNQAAEELIADAVSGIFTTPEDVVRFAEFQRAQAEKNEGKAGTIHKVMNAVKEMLNQIIGKAKEVLTLDPENKAALKAQRLAEAEKKALQDAYFAHAEKAMDNLRAAKENAAALKSEGAAKGVRFQLQEGEETLEKQLYDHLEQLSKMEPVSDITGKEIAYGETNKENAENIVKFFEFIGGKVERTGFGVVELSRKGAKATVQHGNGPVKQIAAAAIPDVIRHGQQIGFVENWKGRGYNTYTFVAPVTVGETTVYEAVVVNEYRSTKQGNKFYVHEVCGSDGSLLVLDDTGHIKQKQESADTVLKTEEGVERPSFPADTSIAQASAESKENNEAVQKNVRFQLSAPVEVDGQKDLVAVHNLTEENLREALGLGGMPSPSIAVVKAQEGHTKYGPISLVFGSDTIDPMMNRANRIYGSDAWTPTRPSVEYQVNADKVRALNTELAELSRKTAGGEFARSNSITGVMDMEASDKSPKQLAEKLAQNPSVKAAYLTDIGEPVDVAMKQEERFTASQVRRSEKTIEAVGGEETLRNIIETDRANGNHELAHAVLDKVREAEKAWAMEEFGWSEEKAQKKAERVIPPKLLMLLNSAYDYMVTEDKSGKLVRDTDTMLKELQKKAPDAEVEAWILPKVEKILGEKGIYNGKEVYTRNGNRRSFAQLHYPYTLENLVNAMNQEDARGKGAWGLSANTLMSTATAEYETLDEVRADKDRLQQMPEETYRALLEQADSQIEKVVAQLQRETAAHSGSSYGEREILGDILLRAAQGKRTAAAVSRAFAKEGYAIRSDTAKAIVAMYDEIAKIPTGYFEAKPQRAVGFDEVRAAILPDNASESLVQQLKDAGVPVKLYKAGDDAARTKLLNEVPNVRFQLAERANRDARKDDQRQASRAIADTAAALDTLSEFFGVTRGVKLSQDSLDGLAARWTKANGSRADRAKLANEARVLAEYLTADGADMAKAQSLAETLAGEVLDGATYRDSELWDEYPDLHKLEYTVNKNGSAKAELVKAYGSWSEAVAEARRHGVTLRQAEGVRDGNPAEQYESVINDTRAVGGIRDGEKAIWKAAAQQAGVDGAQSMESTEWLDVLMNLHDAIKPKMMSRFADDAEYEDARVELAGRMIGDIMNAPEMTDAEAIFEGMQRQGLQMARAAAGTEAGADEVSQGLKAVQKAQRQEFRRRLAANQRAGARDTAVQIDGRTFTNMGDLNEYITYQREEFQRQLKQQAKRLKAERQEALDEAKLFYHERMGEMREENDYLADQVKQEQRRADRAERSLIIQENEIMEWEAENERRREAWQQKQAQRNAIAIETARQQRDEDIAIAKRVAERRVQKARDARKIDEMRRSIRQNSAQLNQMLLRPSKDKYVQRGLIVQAAEVAKLADQVILNQKAVNQLTALEDSIRRAAGSESAPNAMTEDWKQSGVEDMIKALRDDLTASRQARLTKLQEQLAEAEALPDSEKARMLQDRLRQRIRETENRTYLPLTVDQMRLLKTITSSTLHVVRTANKTLSLAKAEEVDAIAQTAAREVLNSKGNRPGGSFDGVRNALTKYQLDMLGGERVFRMLGGYAKDGQMEKLARMLNDGQRKQTKITLEGERLFDNVTGKTHRKEMNTFAGPGAEMVDIGLTDTKGNAVPLTHAMLCSLYMHLQNQDSREHLLTGGLTVPNMKQYAKGNIERAYQEGQTVQIGMLKDADGMPMTETILEKVENALTEYDRAWIADMKDFFGRYTTNLINETSMQLLGYNRAEVKNYYPIAVDKSELATQIEGLNLDATIEGRGFLKNRVKSSKAIMLEECSSVVQRSLRDTAAYAGLALPIRDVQKVLNSTVETEQGIGNLKNGILKEQWGRSAVEYINDLLTDLQTTQRRRDNGVSRAAARLRGSYAGAILTLNPGVAIAQAASLPTAGAVLGADTMAAVVPFVKNFPTKQRTALETEIREHGDVLLDWRKRGSQQDELSDIGKDPTLAEKAMDKLPKVLTGWINDMDEVTVAALWEGSKAYVKNHADEFAEGAAKEGSEDYWQAVNQTYQKVIEQTQPNYTTMQRAGIQRNPDEFVKAFTMFTTQRFQNYGILADAVMDYNAQKARYDQSQTAETLAEKQRAGKQLQRAAVSQVAQTAVFALMKIGADFLLHRWDREQDENGDVTLKSLLSRFTGLFTESAAGNFLYGSEVYSLVDNALNGKDYDVVSATNISAVNDLAGDVTKFVTELRKDTSDMDETKLAAHHGKVEKYALALMEDGMEIAGVPFGNGRKIVEAFKGYVQDIENAANGKAFRFSSLPASATGQYDRLYNAYLNGDTAEAKAAIEKLDGMGKADEVYKQLKARLVKYDETVQKAAQAQVNGSDAQREQLTRQVIRELYDVLGIRTGVKADADKREAVIDCVTGAVSSKANELLKNGNSSATDDLVEALDSGRAQDVQEELDRLLRAGKSVTSLKSKITEVCKPDYLAGSGYDREQMAEMLLRLTDADGKALYEQKTLDGWVKQAEKAAAAAEDTADPYADLR